MGAHGFSPPHREGSRGGRRALLLLILLLIAACNRGAEYTAVGDIVEIDGGRTAVTIRHEAIAGLCDAGVTRFAAATPDVLDGVAAGARVRFELSGRAGDLRLRKITSLAAGMPGMHDHTPHHGGIVAMVGVIHLEALAQRDGRIQLYVTDLWRRPLPLESLHGSVTLNLSGAKQTLPLAAGAEALEATGPPMNRSEVYAHFVLSHDGDPIDMTFALPLVAGAAGAAGVRPEGCVPPAGDLPPGRHPRCTILLGGVVTALATAPDGHTAVIAVADLGVSAWRLPAGELAVGFASSPPIAVPVNEPPHAEAPNAIAISPDGTEAVVALENRILRYAIAGGRLISARPGGHGIIRDVAWSPEPGLALVTSFYDRSARALRLDDGSESRRFEVEREAAAVIAAPDGQSVAVSSEAGTITLFDWTSAQPQRVLPGGRGPARALVFAGARFAAAADDGVVRVWNRADGALLHEFPTGALLSELAVSPDGHRIAAAGIDGAVRLYDLDQMELRDTLQWHRAQILALGWAGSVLISADVKGQVALWDVE